MATTEYCTMCDKALSIHTAHRIVFQGTWNKPEGPNGLLRFLCQGCYGEIFQAVHHDLKREEA